MNRINWAQVAVFGIVALLVLLLGVSLLVGYSGWGPGWGMMGGWGRGWGFGPSVWMGIFMLLFPLGFLTLLALGIAWLVKALTASGGQTPAAPGKTCPNCGRPVQTDWQVCPYCGQKLTP